jgi:ABC-2 type transport system ATP-binding protein
MGLSEKLHSGASTLSRGQRQRLAIGQAIIHSPQVLLLDEPASGLDPEARAALASVFRELQAQGMSLLVSSHILAELDEYSTHMLALNDGRVLEHRALSNASPAQVTQAAKRILRLEFVEPTESIAPWLNQQAGVQLKRVESNAFEIEFSGSLLDQAALIGVCVAAGHRLMTITSVTENLQQSYLKSLEAQRSAERISKVKP